MADGSAAPLTPPRTRGAPIAVTGGRPSIRPWVILTEGHRFRWGGDLRRHYIFSALARRTGTQPVDGWRPVDFRSRLVRPRGHAWRRRARVASCEFLEPPALDLVRRMARPIVLDVHDDPVAQTEALGLAGDDPEMALLRASRDANVEAFRWLTVPSAPFARLLDLDPARVIVAPNGSDTTVVRPEPWPVRPAVGLVSGAAPARGIETLIDAVRMIRPANPDLRLLLWLAATGPGADRYLADLRAAIADEPWIEIGSTTYDRIGAELGRASVLVLPTPPHPYWDSVAPIKLFDCMAAGRPIVSSPRVEPARIIGEAGAGLVARGETAADLAEQIDVLVRDEALARRLGAAGRMYAESRHDWRAIADRVADELLAPRRYHPVLGILRDR